MKKIIDKLLKMVYNTIVEDDLFMDAKSIKYIRASLGMTQEEFARAVGVAHFTVVRWENNMNRPSRLAQEKIKLLVKEKGNIIERQEI